MVYIVLPLEEVLSRRTTVRQLLEPLTSQQFGILHTLEAKMQRAELAGEKEAIRNIKINIAETKRELRKLSGRNMGGPACEVTSSQNSLLIFAFNEAGNRPSSFDFLDSQFDTFKKGIRAHYHEVWRQLDENHYYLWQSYLHIIESFYREEPERPLVLLHCDPNLEEDEEHYHYKRGPHLHVKASLEPLPHAHFGLTMTNLDQVLESADALTSALRAFVKMFRDQVLDAIEKPVYASSVNTQ